jgi:beta-glucosidase
LVEPPVNPSYRKCDILESISKQISLEEKIRLLSGADFWSTHALPEIGLERIVLSDGPSGVRGALWDERHPSISLPSATSLASTWNPKSLEIAGQISAAEASQKGVRVVLGPTINIQRSPIGGRHFECYSEDPFLTGVLASAFVKGVQGLGVAGCPKHYVANDSENERFTYDALISEQALREVYLAPFEAAVKQSDPWMLMSSYNKTNGHSMSESPLLKNPLKTDWGFSGVVVSDWTAVKTVIESARSGQDLAMPGPLTPWQDGLLEAVKAGEVPESDIDEKVDRILLLAKRVGALKGSEPDSRADLLYTSPRESIRRMAADGMVLVRNDGILPLSQSILKLAVIGTHALKGRIMGGGSATVVPVAPVSPLQGLRAALPNVRIDFATGCHLSAGLEELPMSQCWIDDEANGARLRFFDDQDALILDEIRFASKFVKMDGELSKTAKRIVASTKFRALESGVHLFGGGGAGEIEISIDGTSIKTAETEFDPEDLLGALLSPPQTYVEKFLEEGESIDLLVSYKPSSLLAWNVASMTIGYQAPRRSDSEEMDFAVTLASEADAVVLVVGTTESVESEGYDRINLKLPGLQDELVRAVVAANPKTIVAVNAGAPVELPWLQDTAATLITWFPGEEFGNALADVLLGEEEPGGRMPNSWPFSLEDAIVSNTTPQDGCLTYSEGLNVGYRGFHKEQREPMLWFGAGLGYTSWVIESLRAPSQIITNSDLQIEVQITNTGNREGSHVVQAYLSCESSSVSRPSVWLAGFKKISAGPAETISVILTIDKSAFRHWNSGWEFEPATFKLVIASDSSLKDSLHTDVLVVKRP